MLATRLTEPRKVVSLFDPAMGQIKADRRRAYALSRDMKDLGDLTSLADPLTVFTLEPMLPRYQTLATRFDLLFASHCSAIDDPSFVVNDFENNDGRISLTAKAAERIPLETTVELGKVVFEMASVNGTDSPFSLEGISEAEARIQDRSRHDAIRAVIGNAKPLPSKPLIPSEPTHTESPTQTSTPSPSGTDAGS